MSKNKKLDCMLQIQTGLLVTKRKWCDHISYHGGLPMTTFRVLPDFAVQEAIIRAATAFEKTLKEKLAEYNLRINDPLLRLIPTERVIEEEMV
jgi:hypothetical protein